MNTRFPFSADAASAALAPASRPIIATPARMGKYLMRLTAAA
jgi:hypothetical protein